MKCFSEYAEFFDKGSEEFEIFGRAIGFAEKYTDRIIPSEMSDFNGELFDKLVRVEIMGEPPVDMTVAEIELQLGYKVKIINEVK